MKRRFSITCLILIVLISFLQSPVDGIEGETPTVENFKHIKSSSILNHI